MVCYTLVFQFCHSVAMQCLETVFDINTEGDGAAKYALPASLVQIFETGMHSLGHEVITVTEAATNDSIPLGPVDKEKAEKHKSEGLFSILPFSE